MNKPRFYDAAYFYSRVFTRASAKAAAIAYLKELMPNLELDEPAFLKAFLPVLVSRAIGMFLDAYRDRDYVDYSAEAQELFERCMAEDLRALTKV